MEVTVWGRNVEVPETVRAAAQEKVARLARLHDGWEQAEVHFSEERNPRIPDKEICEVTLRGHGHIVRAKAASPDPLTAVDRVIDKLEHQVSKLKTRLLRRSHPRRHDPSPLANGAVGPPRDIADEDDEEEASAPRIVKAKTFDIKPMTPEEAALQMEMLGHTFYLFTNAETGVAAVVYRRNDGDIGLIDVR